MKILNILSGGEIGGIESLCRDIGKQCKIENAFCFLNFGGSICEAMKSEGLKVHELFSEGSKFSTKKFQALKQVATEYDIIVCHHGEPIIKLYYYLLSLVLKKKYVTFVHSCYEKEYFFPDSKIKRAIAHFIFNKSLKVSDKIVFVSKAGLESYLNEFKYEEKKAEIIYNGIGVDKLNRGKINENIVNAGIVQISYIGRLVKVKGVHNLVSALAMIKDKYNFVLNVVGDGPERTRLEEQVLELGLKDRVVFYGRQTDVNRFLEKTNIFVYPSVWKEVFGISIVEAMAYGCIVIANKVGGIPEIIEDQVSGILSPYTTAESLSQSIEKAFEMFENNTYNDMSHNAKERANKFAITNTIDKIEKLYREL